MFSLFSFFCFTLDFCKGTSSKNTLQISPEAPKVIPLSIFSVSTPSLAQIQGKTNKDQKKNEQKSRKNVDNTYVSLVFSLAFTVLPCFSLFFLSSSTPYRRKMIDMVQTRADAEPTAARLTALDQRLQALRQDVHERELGFTGSIYRDRGKQSFWLVCVVLFVCFVGVCKLFRRFFQVFSQFFRRGFSLDEPSKIYKKQSKSYKNLQN